LDGCITQAYKQHFPIAFPCCNQIEIFLSLEANIGRLQMYSMHQKQKNKEEKTRREGRGPCCFQIFEEFFLGLF